MQKDIIQRQIQKEFPGADTTSFFDLSNWREGLNTHFNRGGSEDDMLGGMSWAFYPVAVIKAGTIEKITLVPGDIGGSVLISSSSHLTAHMSPSKNSNNLGITVKELIARYDGMKIEGIVMLLEDRDTNQPNDWDKTHIEIVTITD